jgi:hypothetical protein
VLSTYRDGAPAILKSICDLICRFGALPDSCQTVRLCSFCTDSHDGAQTARAAARVGAHCFRLVSLDHARCCLGRLVDGELKWRDALQLELGSPAHVACAAYAVPCVVSGQVATGWLRLSEVK